MAVFLDPGFRDLFARHPLTLVDVGARGGLKKNWSVARPHLRLVGFEPDAREHEQLVARARAAGSGDRFYNTALHDRRGPITLHLARDRGLSSIFTPNRAFLDQFPEADRFDTTDVQQVPADTMDDVLAADGVTDVDFIKADTQGSELHVLRGGTRILSSSVVGVEAEVEFSPIYTDQPLFADVDAFLRGLGFMLFDLRPCYWKRARGRDVGGPWGQIIWADALYLRSVPSLRAALQPLDGSARKAKLLKAMSVSVLYGYYDYALELLGQLGESMSTSEREAIEASLRKAGAETSPLPKFPGRRRLAAAAHRLWKTFVQQEEGAWSVSNPEIGNHE